MNAVRRFWSKVDKNGPTISRYGRCWIWTTRKDKNGYGDFWISGKNQKAHRVSYQFSTGKSPVGMCVCHKCDNPSCVRPSHLFLGTVADNNADMLAKDKYRRGESHGRAKLTTSQVIEMIQRYIPRSRKHGAKAMAKEFGVYELTVVYAIKGVTWKHVHERLRLSKAS